jgi:amidase
MGSEVKPELWRWSGVDLAHAIATSEILSREVVQANLGRIARFNPTLNAIVEVLADETLAPADAADVAVRAGHKLGPARRDGVAEAKTECW